MSTRKSGSKTGRMFRSVKPDIVDRFYEDEEQSLAEHQAMWAVTYDDHKVEIVQGDKWAIADSLCAIYGYDVLECIRSSPSNYVPIVFSRVSDKGMRSSLGGFRNVRVATKEHVTA
jgi:hypothetical protein